MAGEAGANQGNGTLVDQRPEPATIRSSCGAIDNGSAPFVTHNVTAIGDCFFYASAVTDPGGRASDRRTVAFIVTWRLTYAGAVICVSAFTAASLAPTSLAPATAIPIPTAIAVPIPTVVAVAIPLPLRRGVTGETRHAQEPGNQRRQTYDVYRCSEKLSARNHQMLLKKTVAHCRTMPTPFAPVAGHRV